MYKSNKNKFREIEHTADIGIMAIGETLEDLFANSAFGMLDIICYEIPRQINTRQTIELEEYNLVELLVRWLSEINFLLTVHHFLPVNIVQLQIKALKQNFRLQAIIEGCDSKQLHETIRTEIKAVTYHQLRLDRNEQGYSTRIIFDI